MNPEQKQKLRIANTIAVFTALVSGLIGLNELVDHDKEEKPKIEIVPTWTPTQEPGINHETNEFELTETYTPQDKK